ncbi:MAG: cysteine hydrolase family protein [Deinococcales bacterium]
MRLDSQTLLMLIDLQKAIDHPSWLEAGRSRNNPNAEANIFELLSLWRSKSLPILHIHHMSTKANSAYRPGQAGNDFKDLLKPLAGEWVLEKATNSAFIGTNLEGSLHQKGISKLVVTGVITNNSVEATVRMAGNLGFETYLVEDGSFTFGCYDFYGTWHEAREVHAMSLANLSGEYATIVNTAQLKEALTY